MTTFETAIVAVGLAEVPTRHEGLCRGVISAAAAAGLPATRIAAERVDDGSADPVGATLVDVLRAHQIGADVRRVSEAPVSPDALASVVNDAQVAALCIRGSGWSARLPLVPGFATARFEPGRIDLASRAGRELCSTLFDIHLSEWGIVAPASEIERLALALPAPTDPAPLPMTAPLVYLSPDLTYTIDIAAAARVPGTRPTRSVIGGAVLLCANASAVAPLEAALAPAARPAPRPPIDVFELPGGPLRLRNVSPGLAAWQSRIVGAALEEVERRSGAAPQPTLHGLREVDAVLGADAGALSPEALEGWSALAGQILVDAGGRWRRRLDPWTAFPANLAVQTPRRALFAPHAELLAQRARGGPIALLPNVQRMLGG